MKTKEELNALKEEVETVSRKLHELTEEELAQVSGGFMQNSDGTYNFYKGESYFRKLEAGRLSYTVCETRLNASLDTFIPCEYYLEDANGNLDSSNYGFSKFHAYELLHDYI